MHEPEGIAHRLRNRLRLLGWFALMRREHPEGLIPIATARRVLQVSRPTMDRMVEAGHVRVLTMPGGGERDRFVPVVDLYTAPTGLESGRPWVIDLGTGKMRRDRGEPHLLTKPAFGTHESEIFCMKCRRDERRRKRRASKELRSEVR